MLLKGASRKLFQALDRKDQKLLRRFWTKANGKMMQGKYGSSSEMQADLEAQVKPKAVNWEAIAAFIKEIAPIIEQMISQCSAM